MTFSGKREWSEKKKGHERGAESEEQIGKRKRKGERRVYITDFKLHYSGCI